MFPKKIFKNVDCTLQGLIVIFYMVVWRIEWRKCQTWIAERNYYPFFVFILYMPGNFTQQGESVQL